MVVLLSKVVLKVTLEFVSLRSSPGNDFLPNLSMVLIGHRPEDVSRGDELTINWITTSGLERLAVLYDKFFPFTKNKFVRRSYKRDKSTLPLSVLRNSEMSSPRVDPNYNGWGGKGFPINLYRPLYKTNSVDLLQR